MKYTLTLLALLFSFNLFAQELTENEKFNSGGMDFWYKITNAQEKDDYSRYEVTVFCKNSSEGMIFKAPVVSSGAYVRYDKNIATFNCINATGKRLTSKSAIVELRDLTVPFSDIQKDCVTNKNVTQLRYIKAGSILNPGETVSRSVIFITPKGEKPSISLTVLL